MLWLKSFHLIVVTCWFAGIFYLPRIMVYYAASEHLETKRQLTVMARRLYRFITPIAYLSVALGLALMLRDIDYYLSAQWMWLKLLAVVCLLAYHHYCGHLVARIEAGEDRHTHVYYRVFNEIPVIFLVAIVLLAVLKP